VASPLVAGDCNASNVLVIPFRLKFNGSGHPTTSLPDNGKFKLSGLAEQHHPLENGMYVEREDAATVRLDDSQHIWRYLTVPAFLDTIQSKTLFFASLFALLSADPWEGHLSKPTKQKIVQGFTSPPDDFGQALQLTLLNQLCVNCWHMNDDESSAMWKLYSGDHGVAVKSNIRSLKEAFRHEKRDVIIRAVEYVSHVGEPERGATMFFGFQKRSSFAHERELRAGIWLDAPISENGIHVEVDLTTLFKEVRISPTAPAWIKRVIERELEVHQLAVPVYRSPLYKPA